MSTNPWFKKPPAPPRRQPCAVSAIPIHPERLCEYTLCDICSCRESGTKRRDLYAADAALVHDVAICKRDYVQYCSRVRLVGFPHGDIKAFVLGERPQRTRRRVIPEPGETADGSCGGRFCEDLLVSGRRGVKMLWYFRAMPRDIREIILGHLEATVCTRTFPKHGGTFYSSLCEYCCRAYVTAY